MSGRIYLDYNATAPLRPEAREAMVLALEQWGNPSSAHAEGRLAKATIEEAREVLAAAIGADPSEIVFTSGGTEADNLAILGAVVQPGRTRVVTSAVEHPAVLQTCRCLAIERGIDLRVVPCDRMGRVSAPAVTEACEPDTALVSLMHANNEVGTIQPVAAVARGLAGQDVLVHCDAVQSLGKVPVDVDELGVDLLSVSAHKLGGSKGIGALYVRKTRADQLSPLMGGGEQERRRRPGTENVVAIAGFKAALEAALQDLAGEADRLRQLRARLWAGIQREAPDCVVNGDLDHGLPNTLNVSFGDLNGEDLMMALDLRGLAVSTGSACAVGAHKPSHVIAAMRAESDVARCSPIRFSLGFATTRSEIDHAVGILHAVVRRLRNSGGCCCNCKGTCS